MKLFQRLQTACTAFSKAWKNPDLTTSREPAVRDLCGSPPALSADSPAGDPILLSADLQDGITKVQTPEGPPFIGIRAEARRLGVTQAHLWRVLTGKRESKSLMQRVHIKEVA